MGVKHITLGWSKTLWTHMWIDHICLCGKVGDIG